MSVTSSLTSPAATSSSTLPPWSLLPLDLTKSITDFLSLLEFRSLCCTSADWNLSATGKPRRTRQLDVTPEQLACMMKYGEDSTLLKHVSDLLIKHVVPQKEDEQGELEQQKQVLATATEDEEMKQQEHDYTNTDESEILIKPEEVKKTVRECEHHAHTAAEGATSNNNQRMNPNAPQLYYPPIVTSQITQLSIAVPHLEALSCTLDPIALEPYPYQADTSWNCVQLYNKEEMEKQPEMKFPQQLTNLILVFDNKFSDKEDSIHSSIERVITAISALKHLSYLQLDCTNFLHVRRSEEKGSYFTPLGALAPTLKTLILSDVFNSPNEEDNRRWSASEIALFRSFTLIEFMDVGEWWSVEQLQMLFAEPCPFQQLEYLGSRSIQMTDDMIPLVTRLPKLKYWCPTETLTHDVSYLTKFQSLDTLRLDCIDHTVDLPILMEAIVQCKTLTDLTLHHCTVGNEEMKTICSSLTLLQVLHIECLHDLTSLDCLTSTTNNIPSLPYLQELTISNCTSLSWSEIKRICDARCPNESQSQQFDFLLVGRLSDKNEAELSEMETQDTWPQCLTREPAWMPNDQDIAAEQDAVNMAAQEQEQQQQEGEEQDEEEEDEMEEEGEDSEADDTDSSSSPSLSSSTPSPSSL